MSNHRMFSSRILNSAKFLQMPGESQLLYFHLCLRADDDGVAEAYPVIKLLGTPSDSVKVLLAKGFIQELNEDQVILIEHWREHNKIRADRKVDSLYKNLLIDKGVKLLEAKPRSDVTNNSKRLGGQSTDGLSKDKLSQVKSSKDKNTNTAPKVALDLQIPSELNQVWLDFLEMRKKIRSPMTERAQYLMVKKLEKFDVETAKAMLEQSIISSWKDVWPLKETAKPVDPIEQEAKDLFKKLGEQAVFPFGKKYGDAALYTYKHCFPGAF